MSDLFFMHGTMFVTSPPSPTSPGQPTTNSGSDGSEDKTPVPPPSGQVSNPARQDHLAGLRAILSREDQPFCAAVGAESDGDCLGSVFEQLPAELSEGYERVWFDRTARDMAREFKDGLERVAGGPADEIETGVRLFTLQRMDACGVEVWCPGPGESWSVDRMLRMLRAHAWRLRLCVAAALKASSVPAEEAALALRAFEAAMDEWMGHTYRWGRSLWHMPDMGCEYDRVMQPAVEQWHVALNAWASEPEQRDALLAERPCWSIEELGTVIAGLLQAAPGWNPPCLGDLSSYLLQVFQRCLSSRAIEGAERQRLLGVFANRLDSAVRQLEDEAATLVPTRLKLPPRPRPPIDHGQSKFRYCRPHAEVLAELQRRFRIAGVAAWRPDAAIEDPAAFDKTVLDRAASIELALDVRASRPAEAIEAGLLKRVTRLLDETSAAAWSPSGASTRADDQGVSQMQQILLVNQTGVFAGIDASRLSPEKAAHARAGVQRALTDWVAAKLDWLPSPRNLDYLRMFARWQAMRVRWTEQPEARDVLAQDFLPLDQLPAWWHDGGRETVKAELLHIFDRFTRSLDMQPFEREALMAIFEEQFDGLAAVPPAVPS
ncbi:hypothetical protein GT347_22870 [Xylophilus rhododendri]|uniref:Uncharacterized protein n=1 Tax=Xylophilus rhododendri TaxID=2697032 RepID=A0A857J952_9BURK|nr:hypothetical protein [Xylophilus rhododendri]QHJ00571.1 hypothetical protein GT347_22870 [Xylophilus rhododendri]